MVVQTETCKVQLSPSASFSKNSQVHFPVRLLVLSLLFLQFLPYLLLWDEAYIRIHDTLEGTAAWFVLTLFPFYSDIVWAGLPILLVASGYWLRQFWKKGSWNVLIWPFRLLTIL